MVCFLTSLAGPLLLGDPKKFLHQGPNPLWAALNNDVHVVGIHGPIVLFTAVTDLTEQNIYRVIILSHKHQF